MDNVPADEVKKLGVDKVLTIKFSPGEESDPKNVYEVVFKSIDLLFEARILEALKYSDMLIDLDLSKASLLDTRKIEYCYNVGYVETMARISEIKKMLKDN